MIRYQIAETLWDAEEKNKPWGNMSIINTVYFASEVDAELAKKDEENNRLILDNSYLVNGCKEKDAEIARLKERIQELENERNKINTGKDGAC